MHKCILPRLLCVMVLLTTLLFASCRQESPPNVYEIHSEFQKNYNYFQLVADYFSSANYQSISINYDDEFFWADFQKYPFDEMDVEAYNAINYLFKEKGYLGISKNNTQLCVEFRMWSDHRSVDCGVVYAICNDLEPQPEFSVELVSLQEEVWYYYVSDYNEWRRQQELSAK